ncbi:MAG: type II secretion system F family protein [Anaerovoracaceae bacterium]
MAPKKIKQITWTKAAFFSREMSMFLHGGISLYDGFYIMEENSETAEEKQLYKRLAEDVNQGIPLAQSLKEAKCFPVYMTQLVEVGEASGKLEEVFASLFLYFQRTENIRRSAKNAIVYPLVMVGVMICVMTILMVKVLPIFSNVFHQAGAQMPHLLQKMADSGNIIAGVVIGIAALVVIFIAAWMICSKIEGGKKIIVKIYEGFPFTRKIAERSAIGRFTFAMSLLISSGANIEDAIEMSEDLTNSPKAQIKIDKLKDLMDEGQTLPVGLNQSQLFSLEYTAMIAIGEKVGRTDEMMDTVAERCADDTEQWINKLIGVIEPTLVIITALIIGGVLLSVMLPLMNIMTLM